MPFTVDQFFQVFERYNEAIWPAQILAYLLGLLALAAALRPSMRSGRVVAAVLALFWIWMGAAYHLWQFASINPAAYASACSSSLRVSRSSGSVSSGIGFGFASAIASCQSSAWLPWPMPPSFTARSAI